MLERLQIIKSERAEGESKNVKRHSASNRIQNENRITSAEHTRIQCETWINGTGHMAYRKDKMEDLYRLDDNKCIPTGGAHQKENIEKNMKKTVGKCS